MIIVIQCDYLLMCHTNDGYNFLEVVLIVVVGGGAGDVGVGMSEIVVNSLGTSDAYMCQ